MVCNIGPSGFLGQNLVGKIFSRALFSNPKGRFDIANTFTGPIAKIDVAPARQALVVELVVDQGKLGILKQKTTVI
ncbi:hypothetical protein D3C72_1982380 [compost metagenome]